MRKHIYRGVPAFRPYRVIPFQKLRRAYKKRLERKRKLKELLIGETNGYGPWMKTAMWLMPTVLYTGGMFLVGMALGLSVM